MNRLDPQAKALLEDWSKEIQTNISDITAEMVRDSDADVQQLQESIEEVERIEEYVASTKIGNIPIRVYTPKIKNNNNPLPVFIFFHGGGFVIGSESYETPIRAITKKSKCIVCAVQYSLAPENKFPSAINESIYATEWIVKNVDLFNGDINRIAIGGDSSGGNLAAVVTLSNQNNKIHNFKFLVLIYPMLDATCSQPSVEEFSNGFGFTKEKMKWYFDQYLHKNTDKKQINISPLFAQIFNKFPSTYIVSAECDPLRDEAELFGEKLKKSCVIVITKRYKGMIHGFFQMSGVLDQGRKLIDDISEQLRINLSD
jgi:acetyl esterase